jgi:N-acetylmuramoyl-L-alanine amidase
MTTLFKIYRMNFFGKFLLLPLMVLLLAAFTFKVNKYNNHIYKGKKVTVVIDAGHGGERDPGATGNNGITEKEINLSIAKFMKQYNDNENIIIDLVREDDVYINPAEKAKIANEKNADLFVSLHVDSDKKIASKSGLSVFVAKNQFPNSEISKVFATSILNEFTNNYSLPVIANPMQRQVGIWVLQNVNAPAVLIEAGFITNDKDVAYLQSNEGKEAIAKNILTGIEKYLTQKANILPTVDTIPKTLPTEAQWEKAANEAENDLNTKPSITVTSEKGKVDFYGDTKNIVRTKDDPLYVVDDVIVSKDKMEKMHTNNIAGVHILKGDAAIKKYGDKGKNGVVIITTKGNSVASKPNVAIALDKMNVLYIGLDNPVTIAVSGYKAEDLIVSMKNGSIEGKNGKYVARVTNTNPAEIIIETIENGQRKLIGTQMYRVKHLPDPVNGKNVSDFDIKVQPKLGIDGISKTRFKAEDFTKAKKLTTGSDFEIVQCTIFFSGAGFPTVKMVTLNGNDLSALKEVISNCVAGTTITFDTVKVKVENGNFRYIDGLSIQLY